MKIVMLLLDIVNIRKAFWFIVTIYYYIVNVRNYFNLF